MSQIELVIASIAGGILPALVWLWFWLREDDKHPEPRKLIAIAFGAGMLAVAIVLPIQRYEAGPVLSALLGPLAFLGSDTIKFALWSTTEEVTKFLVAWFAVLRRKEVNEPIDPVIYMVTTALGFAAAENVLFLLSPLAGNTLQQIILTGNLRFVGANLLHVLASSVVGVALGVSFYKPRRVRRRFMIGGVILASILHSSFNFLILNTAEEHMFRTFSVVWIGLIVLIGVLEYIKRIHPAIRRRFV